MLNPTEFHKGQWEAWESDSRVTVVTAGSGGGKTFLGFHWLFREMQRCPGSGHFYGLPNEKMLTRILLTGADPDRPTLVQFLEAKGVHPILHKSDGYISCDLGTIYFASWEAWTNVVGLHIQAAVLDEFDEMPDGMLYRIALERTNFNNGRLLLIGTPRNVRWFHEELTPSLEAGDKDFIQHISFASDANPKYDKKSLARMRKLLPKWQYDREYGGRLAVRDDTGLFHAEWFIEMPEHLWPKAWDEIILVADTAFSKTSKADYSVLAIWGLHDYRPYLMHIERGRWEFAELLAHTETMYQRWLPHLCIIETKGSGIPLYQALRDRGRSVSNRNPSTDKYSRASNVVELLASYGVSTPDGATWLRAFLDELVAFPGGSHDDQVDVTVYALDHFRGRIVRGGVSRVFTEGHQSYWTGKGTNSQNLIFDSTCYGGWRTADGQNAHIAKASASGGGGRVISGKRRNQDRWY
jgi:predicted phage terminase large subunit-like protein